METILVAFKSSQDKAENIQDTHWEFFAFSERKTGGWGRKGIMGDSELGPIPQTRQYPGVES